jgi:hypothetical protein
MTRRQFSGVRGSAAKTATSMYRHFTAIRSGGQPSARRNGTTKWATSSSSVGWSPKFCLSQNSPAKSCAWATMPSRATGTLSNLKTA